ncbi:MAG: hypothetical protein ACLPYW_04690 [Acidimicrobiales bacterium]
MSPACPAGKPKVSEATLSRREMMTSVASVVALGGTASAYRQIDRLLLKPERVSAAGSSVRSPLSPRLPAEQYRYLDGASVTDAGVNVEVPPLHRLIVTARLSVAPAAAALAKAQSTLEARIAKLEGSHVLTATAAGCGLLVAWGLGYFSSFVPTKLDLLPVDVASSRKAGKRIDAVTAAQVFSSDRLHGETEMILEQNDVVFVFGSDELSHLDEAYAGLFGSAAPTAQLFDRTSERRGFVDARHVGTSETSLTKSLATSAGIPGAASIPESAELYLGFTSTQRSAMAPYRVPSFETMPGYTDQWPSGYFRCGSAMSLSHLYEDVGSWYESDYDHRLGAAFSPRIVGKVPTGAQTIPAGTSTAENLHDLESDANKFGVCGHSSVMQPVSRLQRAVSDRYGQLHEVGTSIMLRADVDTLDHPFAWSSRPDRDGELPGAAAGVHFVSFTPTTAMFNAIRKAMDGNLPGASKRLPTTDFTNVVRATHRQNFLVPPRSHRSFPLVELL